MFMANICKGRKYHTNLNPENEISFFCFRPTSIPMVLQPVSKHMQFDKDTPNHLTLPNGWKKLEMADNDFAENKHMMILLSVNVYQFACICLYGSITPYFLRCCIKSFELCCCLIDLLHT